MNFISKFCCFCGTSTQNKSETVILNETPTSYQSVKNSYFDLTPIPLEDSDLKGRLYRAKMPQGISRNPKAGLAELTSAKIDRVVLLCRDEECERVAGTNLRDLYGNNDLKVTHFPAKDFGAWEQKAYNEKVQEIFEQLTKGENIVAHCMGGIGRTGTIIAGVTTKALNLSAEEARDYVRKHSHPSSVETDEQFNLIERLNL